MNAGGRVNFDLDEQQTMLRDLVTRFVADSYGAEQRASYRLEPEGFSPDRWRLLAEMGLLALPFAEAHGGIGGGPIDLITVMEQFGRGLCAEPWLSDLLLAGRLLERAGTPAQVESWLPRIIAGEARLALAHAEHQARFNPLYVACEARTTTDATELSGDKTFVLAGAGVDGFIVSARENGNPDAADGLGLWLVRPDAAGLERRSYRLVDGSVACELRLRKVAGERLDGGAAALSDTFDEVRLAASAEMIGIMSMLFDATLEHARTRRQFGQPIGSFQAIQHRMADLYVRLEQSRSQLLRAALADGAERPHAISGAKSFVSENAMKLGEDCIQLHGGMGVTNELAIGHGHKRIVLLASLLGDAETELARYTRLAA